MYNLMKIEFRKTNKHGGLSLLMSWGFTTFICFVLLMMILGTSTLLKIVPMTGPDAAEMMADAIAMIEEITPKGLVDTIVAASYVVFGGIMIAKYVITEYTQNRIEQLFTYPISRKKIMYSKLLLATTITVVSCIVSKFFLYFIVSMIHAQIHLNAIDVLEVLSTSLAIGLMSHIAMAVGIWRKSIVMTIVTSVILVTFTSGNIGTFSLQDFPIISYTFALAGMIMTARYLNKIDTQDFFN